LTISLLERREIEAGIVAPVFRAFAAEFGEQRAREILVGVVKELARQGGCAAAAALGGNSLAHLEAVIETWRQDEALSLDILRRDEEALEFNVTRCRFAEMYRRLGLEDLGALLSCNRDGSMIAGFNPDIRFQRTQTIMEGASHCDFRYRAPCAEGERPTSNIQRPTSNTQG
jgi:L-2-amino-thiazoline-4-carboxylic acid hydrolase